MSENNVLIAHFPRAAMGYAQSAVDDFVRQIGERLEEMQIRLDELSEQNDALNKQAVIAKKEPEYDSSREVALANAMLAIEQRKLTVDIEIEGLREQARRDIEATKEATRRETDALRGSTIRETDGIKEAARREADGILVQTQSESAQIIGRAKIAAEQMINEAAAATSVEEERLQGLCIQYDHTVDEIRRVLEMQLALLPTPRTFELGAGAETRSNNGAEASATPNFANVAYDDEFVTNVPFDANGIAAAA